MISTICNEIIYPYTNFKVSRLGYDLLCVELPTYFSKTITQASSLYQLKCVANYLLKDILNISGKELVVAINRSLGELSTDHRMLISCKNKEVARYIKNKKPHTISYNKHIGCYQNASNDPEYMTKFAIDIAVNTNSLILLMNPNRIICNRDLLHNLNKCFVDSPLNVLNEDLLLKLVFSSLYKSRNSDAKIVEFTDFSTSLRKIVSFRKRSISMLNERELTITWTSGSSIITNAGFIISKMILDHETVYFYYDIHSKKSSCLGMFSNLQVREMLREYRDFVRYNKIFYDFIEE